MSDATQCRARLVGESGDARCQIWTNADPEGRHVGDHDAYGRRWTNSNEPSGMVQCESSNLGDRCAIFAPKGQAHPMPHRRGARKWNDQSSSMGDQVGGDHYAKFKIQPWDIWVEYGLDAFTGTVVKYLLRAGHKGDKLEDLRKARHTLDRLIEIEEGKANE